MTKEWRMSIAERVYDALHPALAALKADPSGEGGFWEQIAREKAPLIEPDPARAGYSLVTYVFRMPEGTKHVVMHPGFGESPENVLDRLAGTDVSHATYRYRNDVRVTYSFAPDFPLVDLRSATDEEWKAFMEGALTFTPTPDPHARETFTSRAEQGQPDNVASILSLPDAPDQ